MRFIRQLLDFLDQSIEVELLFDSRVLLPASGLGVEAEQVADGAADLVTANYEKDNVSVLLNNGKAGFGSANDYAAGGSPAAVAIADFNGDSFLDLAVANAGTNDVSVLVGKGDGTFAAPLIPNVDAADGINAFGLGDFTEIASLIPSSPTRSIA